MTDMWTVRTDPNPDVYTEARDQVIDPVPVDWVLAREIQHRVNEELNRVQQAASKTMPAQAQRQLAMKLIIAQLERQSLEQAAQGRELMTSEQEHVLRDAVMASMFGLGRIENLLSDPDIEDIYIHGSQPVIVKYGGGRRELRPPVADSPQQLLTQLSQIATHHGQNARSVSAARPWLDLRLPGAARLAAVWDLTPVPVVTIRRHRYVDITLEKLAAMGTLSRAMVAFLQACVIAHRSILVVGGQSAGKTTLLRALCQCIPPTTRFATLETEYELLLHEIPGRFPGIIPIEARPSTGELDATGKPVGEVTLADIFPHTLRHSLDLYIFGETRGAEVFPMMQAMARGQRGSMGTFHSDNAAATFDSLTSLMAEHRANWNQPAAMAQIAGAIDVIVFVDREQVEGGADIRYVAEIIEVGPVAENGRPQVNEIFMPDPEVEAHDPRGYAVGRPRDQKWVRRAGLDMDWFEPQNSGWQQPFPKRWGFG